MLQLTILSKNAIFIKALKRIFIKSTILDHFPIFVAVNTSKYKQKQINESFQKG